MKYINEVFWNTEVPFDSPEKNLYMVYYGIMLLGVFIGVGVLVSKKPLSKPKNTKLIYSYS